MELVEQNISGVKLEKLRKDVLKKTGLLKKLPAVCFLAFAVIALTKNWHFFASLLKNGWEDSVTTGALFRLLGDFMMAAILAGGIFLFYMMLVWKKAYDRFNFSFKNRFVLDVLRQLPGFSDLRYRSQGGFSFEEVEFMNFIPGGCKEFYQSSDELTGRLNGITFRAGNVKTSGEPKGRGNLPDLLFEGQIIAFDSFDDRKISDDFVRVFSQKAFSQAKHTADPVGIQTENSLFNENFVVLAENAHNAFYILTPQVMEQISEFEEAMEGKVSLSFYKNTLYVACSQFHNPFDAFVDVPIEEQRQHIEKDAGILISAGEILVRACSGKGRVK